MRRLFLLIALVALAFVVLSRPWDGGLFCGASYGSDWSSQSARVDIALEWSRLEPGGLGDWIVSLDRRFMYPPLLDLYGAVLGKVTGYGDEALLRGWTLWAWVLALCGGLLGARLGGREAFLPAFAATAFLPAVHGSGYTYHHDLPMTVLVWIAIVVLLFGQDRRPVLSGLAGGVLLVAACLTKWSAPLLAIPLLAATWLAPVPEGQVVARKRAVSGVACGVFVILALDQWFRLSASSFAGLLNLTFETNAHLEPTGLFGVLGQALDALGARGPSQPATHASNPLFMPYRLIVSTLSPVLALAVAAGAVVRVRRDRSGAVLLGVAFVGTLGVSMVTMEDDRLLLAVAPVAGAVAALGLQALSARSGHVAAVAWVAVGLWVAWDWHHTPYAMATSEPVPSRFGLDGDWGHKGIGADSSSDAAGWRRRDYAGPAFLPHKDAAWRAALRCDPAVVRVEPSAGRDGIDPAWWSYVGVLYALESGEPTLRIETMSGDRIVGEPRPGRVVSILMEPAEAPAGMQRVSRIEPPSNQDPAIAIYADGPCP